LSENKKYLENISDLIDKKLSTDSEKTDKETAYLSQMAPNAIEWVTGVDYWGLHTTFNFYRQYQILRDFFNLRCKNCNSQDPDDIDCWGKSRSYLESEILLVWKKEHNDFVCPKCGNTLSEFIDDGVVINYQELICIAGMRSGKSYLASCIGGYIEHVLRVMSMDGRGSLQRKLHMPKAEWLELTFGAATSTQARETVYAKYREQRNISPWINRHVAWVKEQEKLQVGAKDKWEYKPLENCIYDGYMMVRFNSISSSSSGVAGKTRIMATIDELSRLADSESKMSAEEMYRVLNQSLKTIRGATRKYNLFPYLGLMLNVTSPMSINDKAMRLYSQASAVPSLLPRTFFWKGATWEFNPELTKEDFDPEFAKDPVGAQRDYGADPPAAQTPLISEPLRFWKSIDFKREPIATFKTTYLVDKTGKKYVGADLENLKYNFKDAHYVFCDAGETFDGFAIVCAHPAVLSTAAFQDEKKYGENYIEIPEGFQHITELTKGLNPDYKFVNEEMYHNKFFDNPSNLGRMVTVVDFCMRILPTKERDIWFQSIINIIDNMRKKVRIAGVGFDQWQSTASIQAIRDLGIPAVKLKLKSENFMEFVSQVYNDLISLLPPDPNDYLSLSENGTLKIGKLEEEMSGEGVGILELLKLERSEDLRKVVAPKKGAVRGRNSDDIARCIVGVNTLIKDAVVDNLSNTGRKREIRKRLSLGGMPESKVFSSFGNSNNFQKKKF